MNPSRLINQLIPDCNLRYSDVKAGVYKLIHKETGKIYIGSTGDIYHRLGAHVRHLFKNTHPNINLQTHFNSSKEFFLEFTELPRSEKMYRFSEEQKLLDSLFPTGILLNISKDALAPWRGLPMAKITAEAIRKSQIGRVKSLDEIEKIRQGHLGVKKPEGFGEKIRILALNRPPHSIETIEKIRLANTGRKPSLDSIKRMREAQAKYPVFIDGVKYISIGDAARNLGLTIPTVRGRIFSSNSLYSNYCTEK